MPNFVGLNSSPIQTTDQRDNNNVDDPFVYFDLVTDGSGCTCTTTLVVWLHLSKMQFNVRSRVAKDHDLMTLRIPPDLMRRLERAAKHRRQSKNSLIQEFVLTSVAEIEESGRLQKLPPLPPIGAQETSVAAPNESPGLGIATQITKKVKETEQVAPAPTAPVVVQVGNTTPSSSTPGVSMPIGDLDRFAIYVVKGDDFMRDVRKRTAVEVLRCTASTDEEFKVLVARLEELVALKSKTVEDNSGVNKLLKMGWDRLKDFLGEENG